MLQPQLSNADNSAYIYLLRQARVYQIFFIIRAIKVNTKTLCYSLCLFFYYVTHSDDFNIFYFFIRRRMSPIYNRPAPIIAILSFCFSTMFTSILFTSILFTSLCIRLHSPLKFCKRFYIHHYTALSCHCLLYFMHFNCTLCILTFYL